MLYRWIFAALFAAATLLDGRSARSEATIPRDLQGIGIDDNVGALVPRGVELADERGQARKIGDFLPGDKPLVVVLAYYQCPMLCSVVLHHLEEQMHALSWTAGKDFRVLTVSIDKRDDAARAAEARAKYLGDYGRSVDGDGWTFAVGDQAQVRSLADALGFHYRWDESTKQFAHAAGVFVLTPDGRLSRTLYGISFTPSDLRVALTEASQGHLGTILDRAILFCFHYDPNAGSYVVASTRLMKIAGGVMLLALAFWLRKLWQRDSSRSGDSPGSPPAPRPAKVVS